MQSSRALTVLNLIALVVLAVLVWRQFAGAGPLRDPDAAPRPVTVRGDLAGDEQATIELFDNASASVVHVATKERRVVRSMLRYDVVEVPKGTGSGFVWDERGYVVTNYHVVQDTSDREVQFANGVVRDAAVVGIDPPNDLAVLKVDPRGLDLRPIAVGTSGDLRVGQKVFAIGSPFGLDQTLTTGVVSALDRVIESVAGTRIRGVIQTDASINPGNSGGPLLDSAGRLIGVNTAIYSPSGSSAGIGFAVPVDTVNSVVPALIAQGFADRPMLGVRMVPDELAQRAGIVGVVVDDVVPGSGAEAAGILGPRELEAGWLYDVIVGLDGEPVRESRDLLRALEGRRRGEEVEVELRRGAALERVTVRLEGGS